MHTPHPPPIPQRQHKVAVLYCRETSLQDHLNQRKTENDRRDTGLCYLNHLLTPTGCVLQSVLGQIHGKRGGWGWKTTSKRERERMRMNARERAAKIA